MLLSTLGQKLTQNFMIMHLFPDMDKIGLVALKTRHSAHELKTQWTSHSKAGNKIQFACQHLDAVYLECLKAMQSFTEKSG